MEVAIGDGMEFTIHGDLKNKGKKSKMNNTKVRKLPCRRGRKIAEKILVSG